MGAAAWAASPLTAAPTTPPPPTSPTGKMAPQTSGASIEMGAKGSPAPAPSVLPSPAATPTPARPATAKAKTLPAKAVTAKPAPTKAVSAAKASAPKAPAAKETAVTAPKTATAKPAATPIPTATPVAAGTKAPKAPVAVVKPVTVVKPVVTIAKPVVKPTPAAKPGVKPVTDPKLLAPPVQGPAVLPVTAGPVTPSLRDLAQTEKLSNGVTLVTRNDRTSPRVAYSILIRAGAADETTGTAGWRRVLTESMLRASKTEGFAPARATKRADALTTDALPDSLTGLQMQRLAEAAGGQVGASVGDDTIEFWAVGESRGAAALLDVLLQMATHPRLSTADIDSGRRRVGAAGEASQDDVAQSATSALRAQIYRGTAGSPLAYGLVPQGTETSRRGLTDDRIHAFFQSYVRPDNIVVSAAGSFDAPSLKARLQTLTAPQGVAPADDSVTRGAVPSFAPIVKSEPTLLVRQLPTADAWIFVSFLGAPSNGPDLPALAVMSALLGEAPGARLPRRLLGSRPPSLGGPPDETAQQAAVSFVPRRFGSEFVLYAQTQASSVESVKNALLDESRKLRDTSVGEAELMRARNFVRGNWAIDREPLRERAYNAGLAAAVGAGSDVNWPSSVMKVTPADIRRVAQKYLGGYAVALIMPQE